STPVTEAYQGSSYSYDVEADGIPAPTYSLAVSPSGMTIDPATGLIEWTPDSTGDYAVTVVAQNSEGSDTQPFVIAVTEAPPFALRINSGGPTIVDGDITWESSAPYVTGGSIHIFNTSSVDTTANSIADPIPPLDVYKACRHQSPHTYNFSSVPDGDYLVRIHWIDQVTEAGLRDIDYDIEGIRVEEDWDVYAEAGGTFVAIDKVYEVTVSDGNGMQITSSAASGDAFESAIEIIESEELTVNVVGNGSVTLDPVGGVYLSGTTVDLTALADSGWTFDSWSGDLTGSTNPESITMDGDKTVTATFAVDTFTLNYAAGTGGSLIGDTSQVVNYGEDGTAVEAVASNGYHFVDWSDDSTDNPRTDTGVTADITVTANFAIDTAPEIDMQRPAGTSIADNGTDALGDQNVSTVNLTYTIDNSAGTAQLTIPGGGVTAANLTNVSGFSVDTTLPLNVAAGDTVTLDISFDVDAAGAFSFDMDIANNDSDEATYDIEISGTGISAPTVTTNAATGISTTGATLNGTVNANNDSTTVTFEYGLDTSYGTIVTADQNPVTGTTNTAVSNTLSGLTPNTTYHYRAVGQNSAGTTNGVDMTFTTSIAPEIDVQRPAGTPIADSGTDALGNQGVVTINLSYTIENTGSAQLDVTGVTASNYTNSSNFSTSTSFPLNITTGAIATVDISFDITAAGAFSLDMDIANNDSDESTYDITISGTGVTAPVIISGINTTPSNGATLTVGPTQITVEFSENVTRLSAEDETNYLLAEAGANGNFDTTSCAVPGGNIVAPDDVKITINTATYDGDNPFISTLNINNGIPLPEGSYRLFICGTTSIENAAGIHLNNGADTTVDFTVQAAAPVPAPAALPATLPATGFAMGRVTTLSAQPASKAYTATAMMLEIPKLGVSMPIVGVPQSESGWDVTWLGNSAGYLAGSAFPTWAGNTVITGHVWDAYNNPGIFSDLKTLKYGDQIQIHAWGQTYTYEVRESKLVTTKNVKSVLQSEEYDWVTLVTCEFYNPFSGDYLFRRAVRAVLVSIK
ncbi:MAG: sortase, partial [Anaerolineaceae bacterium]|nr:sortase [Anaerolineaceae bacterium]